MVRLTAGVCTAVLLATGTVGCRLVFDQAIDRTLGYRSPIGVRINTERRGSPLSEEGYARLEPGTSTLEDALEAMGAPETVRRTPNEEILEYFYRYLRRTRLIFRPLFWLTYGSSATYNYRGQEKGLDVVTLVFDHEGRLKRKEYRRSAPARSAGAVAKTVFVP
jgi:hypothetical protein